MTVYHVRTPEGAKKYHEPIGAVIFAKTSKLREVLHVVAHPNPGAQLEYSLNGKKHKYLYDETTGKWKVTNGYSGTKPPEDMPDILTKFSEKNPGVRFTVKQGTVKPTPPDLSPFGQAEVGTHVALTDGSHWTKTSPTSWKNDAKNETLPSNALAIKEKTAIEAQKAQAKAQKASLEGIKPGAPLSEWMKAPVGTTTMAVDPTDGKPLVKFENGTWGKEHGWLTTADAQAQSVAWFKETTHSQIGDKVTPADMEKLPVGSVVQTSATVQYTKMPNGKWAPKGVPAGDGYNPVAFSTAEPKIIALGKPQKTLKEMFGHPEKGDQFHTGVMNGTYHPGGKTWTFDGENWVGELGSNVTPTYDTETAAGFGPGIIAPGPAPDYKPPKPRKSIKDILAHPEKGDQVTTQPDGSGTTWTYDGQKWNSPGGVPHSAQDMQEQAASVTLYHPTTVPPIPKEPGKHAKPYHEPEHKTPPPDIPFDIDHPSEMGDIPSSMDADFPKIGDMSEAHDVAAQPKAEDVDEVENYTGSGAGYINPQLRDGATLEDLKLRGDDDIVVRLDDSMSGLGRNATLYRSVPIEAFNVNNYSELLNKRKSLIGTTFSDKGYSSTSWNAARYNSSPLVLKIHAPKGTPALDAEQVSEYESEDEILLGRGMRYRITNIRKVQDPYGDPKTVVDLDALGSPVYTTKPKTLTPSQKSLVKAIKEVGATKAPPVTKAPKLKTASHSVKPADGPPTLANVKAAAAAEASASHTVKLKAKPTVSGMLKEAGVEVSAKAVPLAHAIWGKKMVKQGPAWSKFLNTAISSLPEGSVVFERNNPGIWYVRKPDGWHMFTPATEVKVPPLTSPNMASVMTKPKEWRAYTP